jgi:hypothetical protein
VEDLGLEGEDTPIHHHQCVHDKGPPLPVWHDFEEEVYDSTSELTKIEQIENYRDSSLKRTLLQAPWKPMRIKYNYNGLRGDATQVRFLKNEILEPSR